MRVSEPLGCGGIRVISREGREAARVRKDGAREEETTLKGGAKHWRQTKVVI